MNWAIVVLVLSTGWAAAQRVESQPSASLTATPAVRIPTVKLQSLSKTGTNGWKAFPGGAVAKPSLPARQVLKTNLLVRSGTVLTPGVYKSEPYSCLVIVPDPHIDEKMVRSLDGAVPSMPTVKPDLRFVPWPSKR